MSSAIKHIPLAGRDISLFIQQMLRDRSESVSPEDSLDVARHIKESLCYTAPDIATEFARYDADASKGGACFKQFEHKGKSVDVGYERFLAPEIFFNPEIAGVDVGAPLPELVDSVVQSCPIDGRRGLYSVTPFTMQPYLCVCAEHCALRRVNHVQGLFEATATRHQVACRHASAVHGHSAGG